MTEQARQRLKEMMKYRIIYPDGCDLHKEEEDEYICVNAVGPHPEDASPCDYCEREPCIGVEICEDEYGQDCCFIRRSEYESND